MIHQFRDKKQIAKKRRLIKNILFLITFLSVAFSGFFAYTSGFLNIVGRPLWIARNNAKEKINDVGYLARTKSSIYKESDNFLKENADLRLRMIDYQILKDENESLKELFGRTKSENKLTVSAILTKPNYSPYDTIIIDIGEEDAVSVNDKVYSNVITPIGEVSAVYRKTSLVTLYSNPGKVTEAMMDGSNANVQLVGRGGGNFEMIVPNDLPFSTGAVVYLPGIYPEVIAIVEDVISSPNDPAKKVLLSSPENVQNLKWVFVKLRK